MNTAVQIKFPGLTHAGKMYSMDEIEPNPDQYLIEAATDRLMQYHRDFGKEMRIAKFVGGNGEDTEERIVRIPAYETGGYDDDLENKMKPELKVLASSLGMTKVTCKRLSSNQLKEVITFLRKL